jgi:integrase
LATHYKLTMMPEGKRWRKSYKRVPYYFPLQEGETKATSYARCWQAWLGKKAELDAAPPPPQAEHPEQELILAAIDERSRMSRWFFDHTDDKDLGEKYRQGGQELKQEITELQQIIKTNAEVDWQRFKSPLRQISLGSDRVWMDRFKEQNREDQQRTTITDESVSAFVASFLKRIRALYHANSKSFGRYEQLRCSLDLFVEWIGQNSPITKINGSTVMDYHSHLMKLVGDKTYARSTAKDYFRNFKQFIRHCWVLGAIELPRNIGDRNLAIKTKPRKIITFTKAEVQIVLGTAVARTKLFVLLMLNCGMEQKDISDLLHNEVDWKKGRIRRKRSKSEDASDDVPEVDYKLWPSTLKLLRKFKSTDPDRVLTNNDGMPLIRDQIIDEDGKRWDAVRSAWRRVQDKTGIEKNLLSFRKTSSSLLGEHPEFYRYAQFFLGQSPKTIADKHYIKPSDEQFDLAIAWLGKELKIVN